jgi:hypothetical protein
MRKLIWALPAAAALSVALGAAPASAATKVANQPVVPYGSADTLISYVPSNSSFGWHVGDCYQEIGYLFVTRPVLTNGVWIGKIRWAFNTYTAHTSNFDQWHMKWTFRTASGAQVHVLGPVDGPQMHTGVEYSDEYTYDAVMTPAVFDGIRSVDWSGSC